MERRIVSSRAVVSNDGAVGLALTFDDGTECIGLLDARTIAMLRHQLDRAEAALASPTSPAQ